MRTEFSAGFAKAGHYRMQVTPIGWVLLIVGPLLAILRPRWLYVATIFSLPFTATDIINVGTGVNASGVQAPMYLGCLLLLRYCFVSLKRMSFPLPRKGRTCLYWLGGFIAITALSLIMPVWLSGHVEIPSSTLGDMSTELIHLTSRNITGVLYMVFGYGIVYLTMTLNQTVAMSRLTLKAFMAGAGFMAVWALFELACKVSGIPYPAMIFNTGTALSARGYLEMTAGIPRLSSVAVEPSIFAQTLLMAISLVLPFVFGVLTLFGKTVDRWLFILLVVVLCLTTSSTAYVGLFVIMLTVLFLFTARGILRPIHLVIPLAGLGLAALIYETVPVAKLILDDMVFTKSGGYSALERLMTAENALRMFREHPLLGIGWESITSHDLIANILGNAGILGLLTFAIAMYSIFRALYRSIRSRNKSLRAAGLMRLDFGLYVALSVTLVTSALSGFLNVFAFFWFLCGFAIVASTGIDLSMPDASSRAIATGTARLPRRLLDSD